MLKRFIPAFIGAVAMFGSANAATFIFDGVPPVPSPVDEPTNARVDCGTIGFDFCDVDGNGFDYSKDGISFNATGRADGIASVLIQDIFGVNQGLGVLSEGGNTQDQINADTNESVLFSFINEVVVSNIELNNGTAQDCPAIGSEGGCGAFDLLIDAELPTEQLLTGIVAIDVIAGGFVGTTFEFIARTAGNGFSIESITVNVTEAPIVGALPLLLSGIAGLGFASRRRKVK